MQVTQTTTARKAERKEERKEGGAICISIKIRIYIYENRGEEQALSFILSDFLSFSSFFSLELMIRFARESLRGGGRRRHFPAAPRKGEKIKEFPIFFPSPHLNEVRE